MKKIIYVFCILLLSGPGIHAQWITQSSGFSTPNRGIGCIYAVNDQVVWASAYDANSPSSSCQDITVTTNGGTLWTPHTMAGLNSLDIANIVAVDATTAWVCMYPAGSFLMGQGIYKTTDGGVTWNRQTSAAFSNTTSFANVVYFWDQNTGYCVGDPINGDFEIYTTNNGGASWTLVPGANIPNPVTGEFGVVGYYSVAGNTTWFGTNKGRIYKSADNGHNWTVSAIPGWSSTYCRPYFRDAMNGFAQDKGTTSIGALVRTTDGGTTWTPVTPVGNVFHHDMAYVPGSPMTWVTTGAATGTMGVTYSFDDGVTWHDMPPTIGTPFLATDWISASAGWAGGYNVDAYTGGMYKYDAVLAVPIADFTVDSTTVPAGGQAQFSDISSGGPSSWQWSFPGGNPASSNQQTPPPVTYNAIGQYNVTLTVTNDYGTDTRVKNNYIVVIAPVAPVADFTASQTTFTAGGQVQFSDLSTGFPTSWQWNFPGGSPGTSSQKTPPAITYSTAGQFDVTLTVTNNMGSNTKTRVHFITVNNPPPPVADFMANQTNIPYGGHVQFSDLSTGNPTGWQWTFAGGNPGTSTLQTPPLITYNSAGQYDVTLIATNAGGPGTRTKVKYIYVGGVDVPETEQLSILLYPNPAEKYIVIKSNMLIKEITMLDQFGEPRQRTKPDSKDFIVPLENVPSGLYIMQITTESGSTYKKVVVQNNH